MWAFTRLEARSARPDTPARRLVVRRGSLPPRCASLTMSADVHHPAPPAIIQRSGRGCVHGDGVGAGPDLDDAVAAGRLTNFLIDQPVVFSMWRLTARAANTTVRWASAPGCPS